VAALAERNPGRGHGSAGGVETRPRPAFHLEAADWPEVSGSEADWERDRRTLLDNRLPCAW